MPRKRYKPEEIVAKLRQVDVLVSQGKSMAAATIKWSNNWSNWSDGMKLVETALTSEHVRIRYANDTDSAQASEWIDVRLKLADLTHPSGTPLPLDPINLTLAALQGAALRELRTRADDEIRSLAE